MNPHIQEDGTYNGWSNYETWNVNLWLSNDESLYLKVQEEADRTESVEALAGWLESFVASMATGSGQQFGDLYLVADGVLEAINWKEIAEGWKE